MDLRINRALNGVGQHGRTRYRSFMDDDTDPGTRGLPDASGGRKLENELRIGRVTFVTWPIVHAFRQLKWEIEDKGILVKRK